MQDSRDIKKKVLHQQLELLKKQKQALLDELEIKRCEGTSVQKCKIDDMVQRMRISYQELEKKTHEQITLRVEVHHKELKILAEACREDHAKVDMIRLLERDKAQADIDRLIKKAQTDIDRLTKKFRLQSRARVQKALWVEKKRSSEALEAEKKRSSEDLTSRLRSVKKFITKSLGFLQKLVAKTMLRSI
jgi:hypothetical protein